jgi:hypothetical protein
MRTRSLAVRPWADVAVVCCFFLVVPCYAAERTSSYSAAVDSITAEDLQQHVDFLADDALEGRLPGTEGSRQARAYLQAQLERLEIRPAGDGGTFLQASGPDYRNVLGILDGSGPRLKDEVVLVGAHYDHVGYGTEENSAGPVGQIHNGADDNASGTSAVVELAEAFTRLPGPPKRSILFAFWDAEEMGMVGSKHWCEYPTVPLDRVAAVINLDMIGRLRDNRLTVYGSRTSHGFRRFLSQENDDLDLRLDFSWELEDDADHYAFFQRGIPVLFLHTGVHDQWHSPADDADLINSQGMNRVVRLAFSLLYDLAQRPATPDFRPAAGRETEDLRQRIAGQVPQLRERLGATWQPETGGDGVRISQVAFGSPAARAGIRSGDRIVEFAHTEVSTDADLTSAVMLAGHEVPVVVRRARGTEPLSLKVQLDGGPLRLGITWRLDEAEPGTVILTRVLDGSPAAKAGALVGDRIYRVAGRDFADQEAFLDLVRKPVDALPLLIERDGQLRTVVLHFRPQPQQRAA